MSDTLFRRRHQRQQGGPVRIDRGNALGAKVVTHLPLTPSFPRGTAREFVALAGTGTYATNYKGGALTAAGGGGASVPIDLSVHTSITIAFSFSWPAYANDDALLMELTPNFNGGVVAGFLVDPNASSGAFQAGLNDPGGGYSVYDVTRPSAGVWHRFAMSMDLAQVQATQAIYIDGVPQTLTVAAAAHTGTNNTFPSDTLYLLSRNNASLFATGRLEALTIYKGVLSAGEAVEDARNPYQILQPRPRRRLLSAAAATDTPVNPGVGSLALTGYAPTVAQSVNQAVVPGVGSLVLTGYAPTVARTANQAVAPGVGTLAITGYAPAVTQSANQAVAPNVGTLALTGYAPTLAQTANQDVAPGVGSLAITGLAPTIAQSANQSVSPGFGSLAFTGYAPSVAQSASQSIAPSFGSLAFTGYAPTVAQSNALNIVPGVGAIAITGYAPSIGQTAAQTVLPGFGSLAISGYAPTVAQSAAQSVVPDVGSFAITGYAPTITQAYFVVPGVGNLSITGYAPTIAQLAGWYINPGTGELSITGYAPVVDRTGNEVYAVGVGTITITAYAPTVVRTTSTVAAGDVWSYMMTDGRTAAEVLMETNAMVKELWREHGLDIALPLVVTPTSRVAGTQTQTITETGGVVTVQRT